MDDGRLADLLAPPVARRQHVSRGRQRAMLSVLSVTAAGVLGAGGWFGTGWLRDADLRGALAVSTAVVERLVADAERASTPEHLVQLAADVEPALERLEGAERRAVRVGERGADVAAELAAQQEVLAALEPLAAMGREPLQAWGRVRAPLQEAVAAEFVVRQQLWSSRPPAGQRLDALDRLLPALDRTGTPLLEQAAADELGRLAGLLNGVETTADLRAVAEQAAAGERALDRTSSAAPAAPSLVRCARAVAALAGLQELSGEDVSSWAPVRPGLEASLGDAAALAHADGVVLLAEETGARWRADVEVARAVRDSDAAALMSHGSGVRGLLSSWGQLDSELGPLLDALPLRPAGPFEQAQLAGLAERYDGTRAALSALVAPAVVAPEHLALVQAADDDAAAVRALAGALAAGVAAPPEQVRALFAALVGQRAVTGAARTAALGAWESAVQRAGVLVEVRPLPELPPV